MALKIVILKPDNKGTIFFVQAFIFKELKFNIFFCQ